jgi:hypothetical protein
LFIRLLFSRKLHNQKIKPMNKHPGIYVLLISVIFFGCSGRSHSGDRDCKEIYKQANTLLNDYYEDANPKKLDSALFIVENNLESCRDYYTGVVSLKIRLLILLKAYDRGYKFVDSLDLERFDKPYKKNLYLRNFKAMKLDSSGDLANRDKEYFGMINDINEYIKKHPQDKEAIADLFFIKEKVENKAKILEEIRIMQRQNKIGDSLFYESLKSILMNKETSVPAIERK